MKHQIKLLSFDTTYLGGPSFNEELPPGVVRSNCMGASGQNVPSDGVEVGVAGYAAARVPPDADSLTINNNIINNNSIIQFN